MNETNSRRVSSSEAHKIIGLHQNEAGTFYLPGLSIKAVGSSLEIAYLNDDAPKDTFTTPTPFEYAHEGKKYILHADNGNLVVEEISSVINFK